MLQCITVERPFHKIRVDLLGPFPSSSQGNKLQALPSGKADVVTDFIVNQIVLRHGVPECFVTDRGKCFSAKLTQGVWEKLELIHKTTSGYHPQANGQVERKDHTLAMMISMYITEDQTNWDEPLPFICFAYNTARQESTGFSSFFLLYRREPILPVDILLCSHPNPVCQTDKVVQPYADYLMEELKRARSLVRSLIDIVHVKQAHRYDHNTRTSCNRTLFM